MSPKASARIADRVREILGEDERGWKLRALERVDLGATVDLLATPAGRFEQIQTLLNAPDGPMISQEQAIKLLDFPDLEAHAIAHAAEERRAGRFDDRSAQYLAEHGTLFGIEKASPDDRLRGLDAKAVTLSRREPRTLLVDRCGFTRIDQHHGFANEVVVPCPGSRLYVRFLLHDEVCRDGELLMEYREFGSDPLPTFEPPSVKPPTVEQLARALFETDPEVRAFVNRVGEVPPSGRGGPSFEVARMMAVEATAKFQRAADIAWARNENGWRTRAESRARRIVLALRRTP